MKFTEIVKQVKESYPGIRFGAAISELDKNWANRFDTNHKVFLTAKTEVWEEAKKDENVELELIKTDRVSEKGTAYTMIMLQKPEVLEYEW